MSVTKNSFHISGFWFHVTWDRQGNIGIDQHGDVWFNKANPRSESGGLVVKPSTPKPKIHVRSADLFMYEREASRAYYMNRMIKLAM